MSALNLLTIRQLFNRRRYDSVCRLITSLETAKQEQRDWEKCLAEVKAQAELLTAEKEEMLAKWNEEKVSYLSLLVLGKQYECDRNSLGPSEKKSGNG